MTMQTAPAGIDVSQWDERALLLLGVLMVENQHGYQINDFIENRICRVIAMKKPTAYALLERLEKNQAVSVQVQQEGSRPPRKVFAITSLGRDLFHQLLRINLEQSTLPGFAGDIGLMFLNYLSHEEAILGLKERRSRLEASLESMDQVPPHGPILRIDLAVEHRRAMTQAELTWLHDTIARLESI